MEIPVKCWNYCDTSENARAVSIGELELYFSYTTLVAFRSYKTGLVIRKNDWSKTTEKHLNSISMAKYERIDGTEFEKKLRKVLRNFRFRYD